MNLYIRFFNDETLVTNVEEAMIFLGQVTNGEVSPELASELAEYQNSPMPYPRRFKVRARTYFIVIKTPATTMEEFKARGQQMQSEHSVRQQTPEAKDGGAELKNDNRVRPQQFDIDQPGWYEVNMTFKRVLLNEAKGKNEYVDTDFSARLKARSPRDCYDRVCAYLANRDDIDSRSQMPSIKGRNFTCSFLGMQA